MEGRGPFAIVGGTPGAYDGFTPGVGELIVKATPFSEAECGGKPGRSLTIRLKIIDSSRSRR